MDEEVGEEQVRCDAVDISSELVEHPLHNQQLDLSIEDGPHLDAVLIQQGLLQSLHLSVHLSVQLVHNL
jgi:hypothetical protein